MLCGHVPYHGLDREKISRTVLKGNRPSKPKEAAHLGLFDELWEILQRCWEEKSEARPDLQAIRACLNEVVPHWHVRADLSAASDDTESVDTQSYHSCPSSPSLPPSSPPQSPVLQTSTMVHDSSFNPFTPSTSNLASSASQTSFLSWDSANESRLSHWKRAGHLH